MIWPIFFPKGLGGGGLCEDIMKCTVCNVENTVGVMLLQFIDGPSCLAAARRLITKGALLSGTLKVDQV
jgi:hypothetical protein